jgi:uncharacterized protein (DUF58 family)
VTTDSRARLTRTASGTGASTAHTRVTTARRGALVVAVLSSMTAARRLREAAVRAGEWLGQTVTPAGWLALAAATVGIVAGWAFGWVEWLVAGVASLVLLLMSLPFLFGARAYDVVVRLEHERVVAGGEVPGEIDIRNRGSRTALPGRIDLPVGDGLVELGVPLLRGGHVVSQPVSIPTPHRGIIPVGPPTAVRTDPIGLLRREHAWDEVHELYVHPRTVVVPSTSAGLVRDLEGHPSRRLVDADMSFHAIREYAPGDSRRQIHWKSTAKTGQLMVRQFEESRRSRMAIVLSLATGDYAGDDELELAVSSAASLGVQAVRDGRDLDVVTGTAIPRVVKGRLRAIRTLSATSPRALLDGFSGLEPLEHTMPLEEVCRLTVESSPALSIAFVVCGSNVGLTRLRQAALAFPDETAVIGILCDERAHPRLRPIGSLTLLTVGLIEDLAGLMLRGAQT